MKLVIVESPTKSKTIGHYLGEGYQVEASVGHVRDIAIKGEGGLGIDIEHDFKPTYVVNKDKKDVVSKLSKLAKKCDEVILATDPDREGEAIAWHLVEVLKLPVETTKRLEFHEITKSSILEAIESPRTLDMNIVHSQESRRIIDRIIGFKLSKLLQSKIKSKSAGRVQSVALKLVCDHEKEILAFVPEEYWTIKASIMNGKVEVPLTLTKLNGKRVDLKVEADALEVFSDLGKNVKVNNINETKRSRQSKEPYRTSTLEQDANSIFKMKTREIASIAQQLYEGVETGEGLVGLITYMRTDSTRISESFVNAAKDYIISTYGKEYYKGQKRVKDVKLQQDAHECIRPTSVERTPEVMRPYLNDKQFKLYKLIYNRTVGSLMSDEELLVTTVNFISNHTEFEAKGNVISFQGYNILKLDNEEKDKLPEFKLDEEYELLGLLKEQHYTLPPARYSEGKLVKLMEEYGIGRPSTYSSTIQNIIHRLYVKIEKGSLLPTEQGILTSNVLSKYFPDLMNIEYTAEMEVNLDKVQTGELSEIKLLKDFYDPFIEHFDIVKNEIYKEPLKTTGEKCPDCGADLVIRHGRYGEFISCSNYPTCKFVKKEKKQEPTPVGRDCPSCGKPLVYRKNKKGQTFIGCSNFPKCKYIEAEEDPILKNAPKKVCPDCGADMILRSSKRGYFYGCAHYPKCKHIEPYEVNKEDESK